MTCRDSHMPFVPWDPCFKLLSSKVSLSGTSKCGRGTDSPTEGLGQRRAQRMVPQLRADGEKIGVWVWLCHLTEISFQILSNPGFSNNLTFLWGFPYFLASCNRGHHWERETHRTRDLSNRTLPTASFYHETGQGLAFLCVHGGMLEEGTLVVRKRVRKNGKEDEEKKGRREDELSLESV